MIEFLWLVGFLKREISQFTCVLILNTAHIMWLFRLSGSKCGVAEGVCDSQSHTSQVLTNQFGLKNGRFDPVERKAVVKGTGKIVSCPLVV